MKQDNLDDLFGQAEDECVGCDIYTRVNDLGLCTTCDAKLDRDMIRERDWERSASAWLLPSDKREALREDVISKHGPDLELIAPKKPRRPGSNRTEPKKKRKKKRSGRRR